MSEQTGKRCACGREWDNPFCSRYRRSAAEPPVTTRVNDTELERLREAVREACEIIELGDQRLLASDGPAGNQPPALTLDEWRKLYATLDLARRSDFEDNDWREHLP